MAYEFSVAVRGADEARDKLDALAKSEEEVGRAALGAAAGMNAADKANVKAAAGADSASKSTSALSGAMSFLRKAAELIPGVELGTIFAGLATGAVALGAALMGASDAAKRLADSGRVLNQQLVADALKVNSVADAMERYARSIGLAKAAQLTFREEQDALRKIASGEVVSMEATKKAAEENEKALRNARDRLVDFKANYQDYAAEVTKAGGSAAFERGLSDRIKSLEARAEELNRTQLGLVGRPGANPWVEGVKAFGSSLVTKARIAGEATIDQMKRDVQTFAAVAEAQSKLAANVAKRAAPATPAPAAPKGAPLSRYSVGLTLPGMGEVYPVASAMEAFSPENMAEANAAAWDRTKGMFSSIVDAVAPMVQEVSTQLAELYKATVVPRDAFAEMGDSFKGVMDRMVTTAIDAGGMLSSALQTITGSIGSMMTNLIISGDAGAKGVAKMAGNALAGLSAQAFGYGVLLEGMAAASALAPFLGLPAAGSLAAAGAVMFGVGAGLGVTARLLGADKIGGGARSHAGGGTSGASAAGTNPYQGQATPTTHLTVMIGEEVVTRGVQTATRRADLRGGITEPRMAMGV